MPDARINRRHLLLGVATLPLWPGMAEAAPSAASAAALLGCGRDAAGDAVFGLDAAGEILWRQALPGRGHGMAVAPDGRFALIAARRPGRWLLRIDLHQPQTPPQLWPCDDLAYGGHVVFLDATCVALSASNAEGYGCIAVLDAASGRRIALWPTDGIDPHELLPMPGGILALANGGDAAEASCLVRLDATSGAILARIEAPPKLHRLSLRHMAALPDGSLAVAAQDRGAAEAGMPLLALWQPDERLHWINLGQSQGDLRGYCGAIAAQDTRLCLTSPQGGVALLHPGSSRIEAADLCGVAPLGPGFMLSGGRGDLILPDGSRRHHAVAWDNHLKAV